MDQVPIFDTEDQQFYDIRSINIRDEQIDIVLPNFETGTVVSGKTQARPRTAPLSKTDLNSLLLFPNPVASEAIYYLPPMSAGSSLVVYDTQGNAKETQRIDGAQRMGTLNVGNLPNGTYVVALQDKDQVLSTAKLIIVH